jgi:hypothetical protein
LHLASCKRQGKNGERRDRKTRPHEKAGTGTGTGASRNLRPAGQASANHLSSCLHDWPTISVATCSRVVFSLHRPSRFPVSCS